MVFLTKMEKLRDEKSAKHNFSFSQPPENLCQEMGIVVEPIE